MVRPRSKFNYAQTVIGDCGHTCSVWPRRHAAEDIDAKGKKRDAVICDVCTAEEMGVTGVEVAVWVFFTPPPPVKPAPPRDKRKTAVKKVKPNPWLEVMKVPGQTELFDA